MNIWKGTFLLLACAFTASAAGFETVSKAYEVALADFRPPASANSIVQFRKCRDCDTETLRVTSGTRYLVNGRSVGLQKFRLAIASVTRDRRTTAMTVLHHLESDTVVSVSVTIRSQNGYRSNDDD